MSIDERDYYYNPKEFRDEKIPEPEFQSSTNSNYPRQTASQEVIKKMMLYLASIAVIIIVVIVAMQLINKVANNTLNGMKKNLIAQEQQRQQDIKIQTAIRQQSIETQAATQQQKLVKDTALQQRIETAKPRFERVLVKGKSAKECGAAGIITNQTILCKNDHYEIVQINGNQ